MAIAPRIGTLNRSSRRESALISLGDGSRWRGVIRLTPEATRFMRRRLEQDRVHGLGMGRKLARLRSVCVRDMFQPILRTWNNRATFGKCRASFGRDGS